MLRIRKYFAAWALLVSANAVVAGDNVYSINPNDLTVSGRFQLPSNTETGALQTLVVSDILYDQSLTTSLLTDDSGFRFSFRTALEKSLDNFGYNISTAGSGAPMSILLTGLLVQPTGSGYITELTITMSHAAQGLDRDDIMPAACLPVTAKGQYRVNRAQKRSGGQKALIGIGSFFGVADMDRLINAPKDKSAAVETPVGTGQHNFSQGTVDTKNENLLVRHGLINATQLAIADLIFQLKQSCGKSDK
jgi:hypothetical protein